LVWTSAVKKYHFPLLLIGWWLLLGLSNAVWLHVDTRPPDWDPFKHLTSSLRYFHVLQGPQDLGHRILAVLNVDDYYPPLGPLAVSIFHFMTPLNPDAATWILNQLYLGILLFAVYRLGKQLYSPPTALLASVAVTSFPAILMQSRIFMLDLPITAMTALGIYAFLRTEDFGRTGASIRFGLAAGLATMTKWTFLFFIFLPMLYSFLQICRKEDRFIRLGNLAAAMALWGLVTLPWFVSHFSSLIFTSIKFGYKAGIHEGDPEIFSLPSLTYYLGLLPDEMLLPWFLVFMVGLIFYFRRDVKKNPILMLWIIGGYVILTLLRNKDDRYGMPYLPALALIATAWLMRFEGIFNKLGWFLAALSLYSVVHVFYFHPPVHETWPIQDAFEFIRTQKAHHPRPRVRVVPDTPYFERHAFEYYAERERYPLDVSTWVRFPTFTDFIVTKTGDQGVEHDPVKVMERIQQDPEGFDAVFKSKWEKPLPDGSVGRVYVRDVTPVSGIAPDIFISRFKDALTRFIAPYVKDPQGWTVEVQPYSESETLRGRFRTVRFSMNLATFNDRSRGTNPLTARDLGMELSDLTINPYKLVRDGNLEIISLMEATPRITVREADLNSYLSGLKGRWHAETEFHDGRIRIHSAFSGWIPSLDIELEPFLVNEENLGFVFRRVRVGVFWFPTFLPEILTAKFNPVLKPMPCRMHMRKLRVEHGEFILND
jgi:Dolichyl-phosphate-mannose-protein mannosyltransferase